MADCIVTYSTNENDASTEHDRLDDAIATRLEGIRTEDVPASISVTRIECIETEVPVDVVKWLREEAQDWLDDDPDLLKRVEELEGNTNG